MVNRYHLLKEHMGEPAEEELANDGEWVEYLDYAKLKSKLNVAEEHVEILRNAALLGTVGSCSCMTKTSEYKFHQDSCTYKILKQVLDLTDGDYD